MIGLPALMGTIFFFISGRFWEELLGFLEDSRVM